MELIFALKRFGLAVVVENRFHGTPVSFCLEMLWAMIFWRLWGPLRALLERFGAVWNRLGASWADLESLNCILDASWERLEGFWRRLEAIWARLAGFGARLAGAQTAPSFVWGKLGPVFARFFGVF